MTTAAANTTNALKKIVIVQDYLRNGGTERQSLHLARTLSESGYDVTLLTFRPGGPLKSQNPHFKFHSIQPFDTHLDFFSPGLHAAIRRHSPHIVLCMGRMANCKAGRIARAFPQIAVISSMRTGKKLPAAYARSLHTTRHTIANSHEAARILRETYNVPAEKITVIHNAIVFPPATSEILNSKSQITKLLCVAMMRPEKNHCELIEIFSKLKAALTIPVELELVGEGPALPECRRLAQKLGVADHVHFHGFAANPALFYRDAQNTIAVLTSRSESLPNFLVEAHVHGIPSVAYAVGGVAECGGIAITPGDQIAFLSALNNLIAIPDAARNRAAESARVAAHACEYFSPEKQLQRYLELFNKLTS